MGAARMTGDPLALVEDRHRRCGQEDVEPSMHRCIPAFYRQGTPQGGSISVLLSNLYLQ
jgi:hypothetical protein